MAADLRTLYEAYVDYVARLRDDFDRHVGAGVPERYRPRLLNLEEFCDAWRRWGHVGSFQETWQRRFALGYDHVADALSKELGVALATAGHGCEGRLVDRAA
ncbi:MAG TPA: hypothetical protein VHS06_12190 [Chloroflexota bacterium]|nr:hypothetical protein [Chloroflexota bacterium]